MINTLDAQHRRVSHPRAVISKPLAERSVGLDVARMEKAFDGDFRVRGKWQAGDFAFDEVVGSTSDAAAVVVFGVTELDGVARSQKQQRVLADAQDDGTGLSLLEIFFHMHASVLARRRREKSHRIRIMHHGAISAEVEPAFLRVAWNGDARRADKSAAVQLVNLWHGKLEHIDLITGHFVFEHGSCLHEPRWNRTECVEFFFKSAD